MRDTTVSRVNILGVGISPINMSQTLDLMSAWLSEGARNYVVLCTVYTIMMCQQSAVYRSIVNSASLVTPDGMPLVFLSRWMGYRDVDRVYGPDLMLAFSALSASKGFTQFYYGGAEGVAERLGEVMSHRFPGLRVVGTYSPPFQELTVAEDAGTIERINAVNPDVVWVGLGAPKQDMWIARHRAKLNAPILVGVGAAFDFLTGRIPQAPRWMQRSALEWLFRLWTEPRRLWMRYLFYNPLFVLNVILQLTGVRRWQQGTIDSAQPPDLHRSDIDS
jgi:N-acetylglucosaminyldiphosphoundecaprenol N-acetyl-beta-D-mannosaminyltransferase